MNIEINKESSRTISKQMKDKTEDFKLEIAKLNNQVDIVGGAWQGQDAEKYKTLMREFSTKLNYMDKVIEEYAIYLANVPGIYDTVDDVYSGKI